MWLIDLFRLWLASGLTGAWWMFARFGPLGWVLLAVIIAGPVRVVRLRVDRAAPSRVIVTRVWALVVWRSASSRSSPRIMREIGSL